ncbi:uncharacterized protein LOC134715806 [Mytilus trossulus]|uniref:uncharacterized protein LOC134715806 n=1 Tax=Mytilus trossulus TaxID=6551 RepID=UPI0030074970
MPPLGEKMWITNYMDSYNKDRKYSRKFSGTSRYNTPKRKPISERLEFLARPKTPARPKTASVVQEQNTLYNEKSQPVVSFDEFNKQFTKLRFDSNGYVVHPYSCPPEVNIGVQGTHVQLSERENKNHYMQPILEAADSLPKTELNFEKKEEEEEKENDEEEENTDNVDKPDEIPTVATPVPDALTDKTKDYHWLCWPEPKPKDEPPLRPHTSLGIHRALTPYGGVPGDDIEDRPSSTIPGYAFGDSEDITRGPPMTYVPELKSWVNSSNEYDKDIAQNIMNTMYSSLAPPLPAEALRPKRQMTFSYGGRRSNNSMYNSMPDPLTHYSQSWRPVYEDRRGPPSRHEIVPSFPQIPGLQRSKTDLQPMKRRTIRYPAGDDYVHERSMFMTTQPSCTGHFIIHPDWVSERSGKRKLFATKKNGNSRNGLRYGTPHEI